VKQVGKERRKILGHKMSPEKRRERLLQLASPQAFRTFVRQSKKTKTAKPRRPKKPRK